MIRHFRYCLILSIVGLTSFLASQVPPEPISSTFNAPVEHPIKLSGTFAELRNSHFHGGIDIKSQNGSWGDPVFAIESGYISRISVTAGGFGNALYITHANGLTSVYAHLQSFTKEIDDYVFSQQQAKESFAVNLKLAPELLPVERGQFIGKMGSTGHSFGPHLHFEIRNSKTENLINPLHFEFDVEDHQPPLIRDISIYSLDYKLFNYQTKTLQSQAIRNDTIEIDAWRVGLGLETIDPHNGGQNKNGIYGVQVFVDNVLWYAFNFDSLEWKQMSSYKTHIDFRANSEHAVKIHRCYRLPTNELIIYDAKVTDGVIPLFRNRTQHVRIVVFDFARNENSLEFYLRQTPTVSPPVYPTFHYHIMPGRADTITNNNLELIFPEQALFEDLYCTYKMERDSLQSPYSFVYYIHDDSQPLKNPVQIRIKPLDSMRRFKSKFLIVSVPDAEKVEYHESSWENEWLTAEVSALGKYMVAIDTLSPTITMLKNTRNNYGRRHLVFRIDDDHSGSSLGLQYEARLDDRWLLARYDLKSKQVSCSFNEADLKRGAHHFKLLVTDPVANKTKYDFRFSTK
ncbi:MAG: M23 family metallopeptidase [Saprospiraceae bacterium]|nr:M23 family metallopeptidase [Saprospiraceae bacterium]